MFGSCLANVDESPGSGGQNEQVRVRTLEKLRVLRAFFLMSIFFICEAIFIHLFFIFWMICAVLLIEVRPKCTYTRIGKRIVFHPLNLLYFGDGRRHEEGRRRCQRRRSSRGRRRYLHSYKCRRQFFKQSRGGKKAGRRRGRRKRRR